MARPLVGSLKPLAGSGSDLLVQDLDVRLDRLRAVLVAAPVVDDGRDVGAADGADRVRLGEARGDDAGEVAGLCLGEDDALVVGEQRGRITRAGECGIRNAPLVDADPLVDANELDVRVLASRNRRVGADQEADGHDDVEVLVDERLDVCAVVGDVLGDDDVVLATGRLGGGHRALVRGLVERLVLELPDVGDDTDLERPHRGGRRRSQRWAPRRAPKPRTRRRRDAAAPEAGAWLVVGAAATRGNEDGQAADQRQAQ